MARANGGDWAGRQIQVNFRLAAAVLSVTSVLLSVAVRQEDEVAGENWFNDGDFSGDQAKTLLEQYKLYVDSSSKVSDRRGTANTFLMSVNSALVAVYGLAAGKDATLAASNGAHAWLIPVAGLTISLGWIALIRSYRALNRAKFDVICRLEERLPARVFGAEWEYLKAAQTTHVPLTYVEQLVPTVFAIIYAVLLFIAAL